MGNKNTGERPTNIFEQILMCQKITNDNVATLAENLNYAIGKMEDMMNMLSVEPMVEEEPEHESAPHEEPVETHRRQIIQ